MTPTDKIARDREAVAKIESGWLIEHAESETSSPVYLTMSSQDHRNYELIWSHASDQALRFARKKDARDFASLVIERSKLVPLGQTLHGLRDCDPFPRIAEHQWG